MTNAVAMRWRRGPMGWRFFRRMRVIPGVRMNLSKSGVSASVGWRGLRDDYQWQRAPLGKPGLLVFVVAVLHDISVASAGASPLATQRRVSMNL